MKLLALETASDACSAALYWDGEISEIFEVAPRLHAERALNMFTELLAWAGGSVNDLDGLSFGRGPGAFTGVRVATAVVQGVAFAVNVPVVGVSSLQAMAQGIHREHGLDKVACAFDARMNEVYWGAYQLQEDLMQPVARERVCGPGKVELPGAADGFSAAGAGWLVHGNALNTALGSTISPVYGEALPHARDVLALSLAHHRDGRGVAAEEAVPVYLRDRVVAGKT